MTIKDYINSNYTIIWAHPQATQDDWNTFLLEENHSNKAAIAVNGQFISLFATPGSFFLSESNKYLERSMRHERDLRTWSIWTPHITSERNLGWDNCNYFLKEPLINASNAAADILEMSRGDCTLLYSINWEDSLRASIGHEENSADNQEDFNMNLVIEEAINTVAQEMQNFVDEQFDPLIDKLLLEHEKKEKMVKNLKHISDPVEYENCCNLIEETNDALDSLINEKWLELSKRDPGSNDFPERTQCMVTTLEKISDYIEIQDALIFLISGTNHLEENSSMPEPRRKLCSLEPLYKFLSNHKNIVILKPKALNIT